MKIRLTATYPWKDNWNSDFDDLITDKIETGNTGEDDYYIEIKDLEQITNIAMNSIYPIVIEKHYITSELTIEVYNGYRE